MLKAFDLDCGIRTLHLSQRTHVMGILNVTPDSFYDGGQFIQLDRAVEHAVQMEAQGADMIDIGGESTRPGADRVEPEEETERILPVIRALKDRLHIPISVDTRKARVAEAALQGGAHMVNDVSGLTYDPRMGETVARFGVPIILMHMRGTPKDMQKHTHYSNLMEELICFFKERILYAAKCGITREKIILDPGIGFGKHWEDNFDILRNLHRFQSLGRPLLVGVSRKSFIGRALELAENERLTGTIAAVTAAVLHGAHIVRVHDIPEAVQAVRIADRTKTVHPSIRTQAA